MNRLMHTAICALVLGLLTLGYFTLRYVYSPGDFLEMIRRTEEIDRLKQTNLHHLEALRQAAQAYIARRCTLAQTLQRWKELEQELGQEWPFYRDILRQLPALSDDERRYEVIRGHIKYNLRRQPEKLAAVLRRLASVGRKNRIRAISWRF
jgi:hypothetical protein